MNYKKNTKVIKYLVLSIILSCNIAFGNNNIKPTRYRIVDKKGRRYQVERKVPAYNQHLLKQQSLQNGKTTGRISRDTIGERYYTNGIDQQNISNQISKDSQQRRNDNTPYVNTQKSHQGKPRSNTNEKGYDKDHNGNHIVYQRKDSKTHNQNLNYQHNIEDRRGKQVPMFPTTANVDNIPIAKQSPNKSAVSIHNPQSMQSSSKYTYQSNTPQQQSNTINQSKNNNTEYYVHAGTFSNRSSAQNISYKMSITLKMPIEPQYDRSENNYIVKIGPLFSKDDADVIKKELEKSGYKHLHISAK